METRICKTCKEEKPLETAFSPSKVHKSGWYNDCRVCRNAIRNASRNNPSKSCKVKECTRQVHCRGMCKTHYKYWRNTGSLEGAEPLSPQKSDQGWVTPQGYRMRYKPKHPNASVNGSIPEHMLFMSEHLGRPLLPGENVHHKNGVRDDNRLENLELWTRSQPSGQRVEDKIAWAIELLQTYKPEALCSKES